MRTVDDGLGGPTGQRVLVTGGSGFVGRSVVAEFQRRGVDPRPGHSLNCRWAHFSALVGSSAASGASRFLRLICAGRGWANRPYCCGFAAGAFEETAGAFASSGSLRSFFASFPCLLSGSYSTSFM